MIKCLILLVLCSCVNCLVGRFFTPRDCYLLGQSSGYECLASITKYRYNPYLGYCEQYTYGGCNESPNSFNTYEECAYITYPICRGNSYPPLGPRPPQVPLLPSVGGELIPPIMPEVRPPWMPYPSPGYPWHITPPSIYPMKKK